MPNFTVTVFQLCRSAVARPSVVETKFNAIAHLPYRTVSYRIVQTLPHPTISRSFPFSNALIAKWLSQTLSFKQTNKQTNKKHRTFSPPCGGRYPSPTKLGTVIQEVSLVPFLHL